VSVKAWKKPNPFEPSKLKLINNLKRQNPAREEASVCSSMEESLKHFGVLRIFYFIHADL
jgi:hypothetical protein